MGLVALLAAAACRRSETNEMRSRPARGLVAHPHAVLLAGAAVVLVLEGFRGSATIETSAIWPVLQGLVGGDRLRARLAWTRPPSTRARTAARSRVSARLDRPPSRARRQLGLRLARHLLAAGEPAPARRLPQLRISARRRPALRVRRAHFGWERPRRPCGARLRDGAVPARNGRRHLGTADSAQPMVRRARWPLAAQRVLRRVQVRPGSYGGACRRARARAPWALERGGRRLRAGRGAQVDAGSRCSVARALAPRLQAASRRSAACTVVRRRVRRGQRRVCGDLARSSRPRLHGSVGPRHHRRVALLRVR